MAVTANTNAPYAPATAVLDLVARHRDRGLPAPITTETLQRAGVSESLTPRTLQSLRILDLIDDDGRPTPIFEGLRLAPEAEYQQRLRDWIKASYADVFSFVDPAKHSLTQVRDAFRSYQPTGQQDRMVNLFLGLCVAAGIIEERERSKSPTAPRPSASVSRQPKQPSKRIVRDENVKSAQPTAGLPPALSGLLQSLPVDGQGWTKEQRDRFMATFGAVIDFVIPLRSRSEEIEDAD
jgi:hypothetical protein